MDPVPAFTTLARAFPSLHAAGGTDPWNVDPFLEWLCGPAPTPSAVYGGQFLLAVWNPVTDWRAFARERGIHVAKHRLVRFDLFDAMSIWDDEHHAAFRLWIDKPFWP